jgi:hypothetical protein
MSTAKNNRFYREPPRPPAPEPAFTMIQLAVMRALIRELARQEITAAARKQRKLRAACS